MSNLKIIFTCLVVFAFTIAVQAQSTNWISLSEAQKQAAEQNKKVMVFAEADWCGYCTKMHRKVFPDQSVQDSLEKYFYPVKIDIESNKKVLFNSNTFTEKGLARKFRITSTPTIIFLDAKGKVLGVQPGYLPTEIFDKLLAYVGADLRNTGSFKSYLKKHDVDI